MIRIEATGGRGLGVRLHLESGDPIEVTVEAWERIGLSRGAPLPAEVRERLVEKDADVRIREAALNLLSYRARTKAELSLRLRRKGFAPARVESCLRRLGQRGLLDDQAVGRAFVRDRLRHRPRGRRRLESELRAKGLAREEASRVVQAVFQDERTDDHEIARRLAYEWVARQPRSLVAALASTEWTDERERAHRRLRGYLSRRGLGGDASTIGVEHAVRTVRRQDGG